MPRGDKLCCEEDREELRNTGRTGGGRDMQKGREESLGGCTEEMQRKGQTD